MMWLNPKIPEGHRSSWMKRILLFSVILCFLVVFNLSLADELTDPDSPNWGHPWNDPAGSGEGPSDPPADDDALLVQFGFNHGIILLLAPAGQERSFEAGRSCAAAHKGSGRLFILVR